MTRRRMTPRNPWWREREDPNGFENLPDDAYGDWLDRWTWDEERRIEHETFDEREERA